MRFALALALLFTPAFAHADDAAVRRLLDAQVAAWNRHDLEGYMAGYWHSPELTFYSGGTVTRGWQPTLDRYRKRYQGEGREMGHLDFEQLQIESFGERSSLARGRWRLTLKSGQLAGLFTVVLRQLPEGWRIVHDHSSIETAP